MIWKNLQANNSNKIAHLLNIYFTFVFLKKLDKTWQPSEHPTIRLSDFTINLSEVSDLLSKITTSSMSSDPIPTFVLNSCRDSLAPMAVQLFTVITKARNSPNLWNCSIKTPIYKSGNPERKRKISTYLHSTPAFTYSWETALPTRVYSSSNLNMTSNMVLQRIALPQQKFCPT